MGGRTGAFDAWEKFSDKESWPTLDLTLPCWERGRIDRRRIHEPLDDTESRRSSLDDGGPSLCRANECRLLATLGGVSCVECVEGGLLREGRVALAEGGRRGSFEESERVWLAAVELPAMLVAGRESATGSCRKLSRSEPSFLLGDDERDCAVWEGWAKTRPTAAAATTLLVPTICTCSQIE